MEKFVIALIILIVIFFFAKKKKTGHSKTILPQNLKKQDSIVSKEKLQTKLAKSSSQSSSSKNESTIVLEHSKANLDTSDENITQTEAYSRLVGNLQVPGLKSTEIKSEKSIKPLAPTTDGTLDPKNKIPLISVPSPINKTTIIGSIQDELAAKTKLKFPNAEIKKINQGNFLDIHLPTYNSKKGSHLFFNTSKDGVKIGFYCRDDNFVMRALSSNPDLELYSQGFRLKGNPSFNTADSAIKALEDLIR